MQRRKVRTAGRALLAARFLHCPGQAGKRPAARRPSARLLTMSHVSDRPMATPVAEMGATLAELVRRNDALRLSNDALGVHNAQLHAQLDQQRQILDGLQAFVVSVARALQTSRASYAPDPRRSACLTHLATLTIRQREVLALVVAGHPSKRIASMLGISQRTVENHRASIMLKTGSTSLPALTQLVVLAGFDTSVMPARTRAVVHPISPAITRVRDVAERASPVLSRAVGSRRR